MAFVLEAVNEHDALVAVAEAASKVKHGYDYSILIDPLANLAAVRKSKAAAMTKKQHGAFPKGRW